MTDAPVQDSSEATEAAAAANPAAPAARRRWPKAVLISLLVLTLVVGAIVAAGGLYATNQLEQMQSLGLSADDIEQVEQSGDIIDAVEKAAQSDEQVRKDLEDARELLKKAEAEWAKIPDEKQGRPVNFLILGSDSRTSAGDPTKWEAEAQRTDVIMVLQVSTDRKHVAVMSIPRDSAVVIPGHENEGRTKINLAYAHGGLPLLVKTVQQITGIHMDHVMTVDFTTFQALTDVVGGVTLTSQGEGTKTYNGTQALKFVRYRKGLPLSDRDRVRRQQLWMRAVFAKLFTKEVMGSPTKLKDTYDSLAAYIAVDNSLTLGEIMGLASALRNADIGTTQFVTAPTFLETEMNQDNLEIINIDYNRFVPLCYAFQAGQAWDYIQSHNLETLDSRPVL